MTGHELGQVFITGRDHGVDILLLRPVRERADDIVSLNAGHTQHRPTHGADRSMDRFDLTRKFFGH